MRDSSHLRGSASQQLEIPPSLNSKQAACFSSFASFSTNAGFLPRRGDFNARKDSIVRLIFSGRKDFSIRLIFSGRKDFSIHLIFSGRKDFSIRLIFSGCKYLYIFSVFYFS